MFKRIRDFIYDINDIFVALVIVIIAAGIIVWRSSNIMSYPQYLQAKIDAGTANSVHFSEDDLRPTPVDDPTNTASNTQDPEKTDPADPEKDPNKDPENGEDPSNGGTTDPDPGKDPENGEQNGEDPNKEVVTAVISITSAKGGWAGVAQKLIDAGLIDADDKAAFVKEVNRLGLATRLQRGNFTLSSDMSFEKMIKTLCKIKN